MSRSAHAPTQLPGPRPTALALLALATLIGAIGLAAGGSAGALLGERLGGSDAAGLPLGVLVLGSAASAMLISRLTTCLGRGPSLALGYLVGGAGAGLVIVAVAVSSLLTLLVGSTMLGAANAAVFLTRYAAAELGGAVARGRSLGIVFFATAVGAVTSAGLLGPSARLAQAVGLPDEAGLYVVALVAYTIAAALLAAASTQRLGRIGRAADPRSPRGSARIAPGELRATLQTPPVWTALVGLGTTNFTMVAVMAIAPVHLSMDGMTLQLVGVVIAVHVAGMFAPAPASGWLADGAGPRTAAATGAVLLLATSITGAVAAGDTGLVMSTVLAALGIGWNLGVVGASTQLAASVPSALRPHAEGIGEGVMGVAAAAAAPLAGLATHLGGFRAVWLAGGTVTSLSLMILHQSRTRRGTSRSRRPRLQRGAAR